MSLNFLVVGLDLLHLQTTHIKKGGLIAQYIGRFLVLSKLETDLLFHPMFVQNHERLIELGPVMQPIVYANHPSALDFQTVSSNLSLVDILFYKR